MKKKKISKGRAVLLLCICIVPVLCTCVWPFSRFQHTSPKRLPNRYNEAIEPFRSTEDQDGDGIDDQTDILQGALDYIASCPKYKSKYYRTGYPDDGCGVCTDVVARALRNAGYDLMELVSKDILGNPEDYAIDKPDKNIDFRRVKNLKIYFSRNAASLTMDITAIEEWQGGDIVIFKNHIGIISDRRNADGIPYVIHHNDP